MHKLVPGDAILIPAKAKRVFTGVIYDVYQWEQELFDGSAAIFEMLKRPDTVSVIGIVEDKILLVDDEQPGRPAWATLPGGRVDATDPSLLAAAQREVREETGYSFSQWRLVKIWQPASKIEWFVYYFVAWDVAGRQKPETDAGEKITMRLEPFETVKREAMTANNDLQEVRDVFETVTSLEQLRAMPEVTGQLIERCASDNSLVTTRSCIMKA